MQKRGRDFQSHGGGDRNSYKKQKPNNYGGHGSHGPGGYTNQSSRPQNFNKDKQNPLDLLERYPDPKDCSRCHLAAGEKDSGMIALLDQIVQEEAGPNADQNILRHARELRDALSKRANKSLPSKSKTALDQKRPEKEKYVTIPSYIAGKLERAKSVPPLPPITEPYLEQAVFTHTSANHTNVARRLVDDAIDYERLEFLGDAYIELIASRLIYSRFPHLEPSKQSHFRENLVKNETLQVYSEAYGFHDRLKHGAHLDATSNKNYIKVQADVFEAYVAAIVLSDPENGYATAEKWLTELWAPKLLEYKEAPVENPKARDEINKLLMAKGVKLDYRMEREMEMVNGLQKFFITLYLTGWGFENKVLGKGEGQNKSQACVMAAMNALENSMETIMKGNQKKLEMYPPKAKDGEQGEKKENGSAQIETPTDEVEDADKKQKRKEKKDKKKDKKRKAQEDDAA